MSEEITNLRKSYEAKNDAKFNAVLAILTSLILLFLNYSDYLLDKPLLEAKELEALNMLFPIMFGCFMLLSLIKLVFGQYSITGLIFFSGLGYAFYQFVPFESYEPYLTILRDSMIAFSILIFFWARKAHKAKTVECRLFVEKHKDKYKEDERKLLRKMDFYELSKQLKV